jgi:hypothetical protein
MVEMIPARTQEILTSSVPGDEIAGERDPDVAVTMIEHVLSFVLILRNHHPASAEVVIDSWNFPDSDFIRFFVDGDAHVRAPALGNGIGKNAVFDDAGESWVRNLAAILIAAHRQDNNRRLGLERKIAAVAMPESKTPAQETGHPNEGNTTSITRHT